MTTETKNERFAIVPQALISHPGIDAVDKLILTHCLGKYQTKTEDGQPWTFSVPGIVKGTALNERTVRRHVKKLRKHRLLKLYGCLMNGKKKYDVFVFVREELDTLISTADKLSVVIPLAESGFDAIDKTTADISADKLSAQIQCKRKIVEEREYKEDEKNIINKGSQPPLRSVAPVASMAPRSTGFSNEQIKERARQLLGVV